MIKQFDGDKNKSETVWVKPTVERIALKGASSVWEKPTVERISLKEALTNNFAAANTDGGNNYS